MCADNTTIEHKTDEEEDKVEGYDKYVVYM